MKRSHLQTILLGFLLASCAGLPARAQSGEPVFAATTKNKDDQVNIHYEDGIAFIDVLSPTGIGSATFALESGVMPGEIRLRLHLQGLEEFRLTSAETEISASVSGAGPHIEQKMITSGNETVLLPGNPLWMEIDIAPEDAAKNIPLQEGHFEILLPEEFLREAGTSFEITWIDFYR